MSVASDIPVESVSKLAAIARRLRLLIASSLFQKSGLAVLDQAVVSGTSFATSALLARCASRDELGVYYLALSVIYFARGIQEQVVSAPYTVFCGRRSGESSAEYAGSALLHQCGVMAITVAVLGGLLLAGLAPPAAEAAFWLLLFATPLLLFREFARQMAFAHLDLRGAMAMDVAAAALQLGSLLWLSMTNHLSIAATLAVLAISSGLPAIAWLSLSRQRMVGRLSTAVRDLAHNWPFARWALASQLLACAAPYIMPWVVVLTHGEAETGTLGACTTLVGLSNTFLMGLCNFLSPRAARAFAAGGLAELKSVLKQTAALFVVTLGSLAAAAFLFGEEAAVLVYGPSFAGTRAIIGVLSLSVLANSLAVTAGNGLFAIERPSANFVADLVSLAIVIAASIVAVPLLGPLGAALALLAGTSSDALVRLWILRQTMRELAAGEAAA